MDFDDLSDRATLDDDDEWKSEKSRQTAAENL